MYGSLRAVRGAIADPLLVQLAVQEQRQQKVKHEHASREQAMAAVHAPSDSKFVSSDDILLANARAIRHLARRSQAHVDPDMMAKVR
jgi:hypothetical protein